VTVFSCLEVEVLFFWLWAKHCVSAGMKTHCWYAMDRGSQVLSPAGMIGKR